MTDLEAAWAIVHENTPEGLHVGKVDLARGDERGGWSGGGLVGGCRDTAGSRGGAIGLYSGRGLVRTRADTSQISVTVLDAGGAMTANRRAS